MEYGAAQLRPRMLCARPARARVMPGPARCPVAGPVAGLVRRAHHAQVSITPVLGCSSRWRCRAASADSDPAGDEQLDPQLDVEFGELLARTTMDSVKRILERNKALLLKYEVTSEEALQGLTREDLEAFGLSIASAAALKEAFRSPTTTGYPSGPRVTLKQEAAQLKQHEDDPTMYDVIEGDNKMLFHDPNGTIASIRAFLKEQVAVWCKRRTDSSVRPLVFSGGVKAGKTYQMNTILTALMAEMPEYANASVLRLNLFGLPVGQPLEVMAAWLLNRVVLQAKELKIDTAALRMATGQDAERDPWAMLEFVFQQMDVPLVVLCDEVQTLFMPGEAGINRDRQLQAVKLLKTLLCESSRHCLWAVTGSSMPLFWVHLAMAPVNGISPMLHAIPIDLPPQHQEHARRKVLKALLKERGLLSTSGDIPREYDKLLEFAENCALLTYTVQECSLSWRSSDVSAQAIALSVEALETGKLAVESLAEWSAVLPSIPEEQRCVLAGLYNSVEGCNLSRLGVGLRRMLQVLTVPVPSAPNRVYLKSWIHRGALAMAVTVDGKIMNRWEGSMLDRHLGLVDAYNQLNFIGNTAKLLLNVWQDERRKALCEKLLGAQAARLVQQHGDPQQWLTQDWFKLVLLAGDNQGTGGKPDAEDEEEAWQNGGTAAVYLKQVDWHNRRKKVMPAAEHLAWHLNLFRNVLDHVDSKEKYQKAFELLEMSPVVQPAATLVDRFADVRGHKR